MLEHPPLMMIMYDVAWALAQLIHSWFHTWHLLLAIAGLFDQGHDIWWAWSRHGHLPPSSMTSGTRQIEHSRPKSTLYYCKGTSSYFHAKVGPSKSFLHIWRKTRKITWAQVNIILSSCCKGQKGRVWIIPSPWFGMYEGLLRKLKSSTHLQWWLL